MIFNSELPPESAMTALHEYVAQPDEHYAWKHVEQQPSAEVTRHVLSMTSQVWRTTDEVDRVLWQHWLVIYMPKQVDHETALLKISGGDNTDVPPTLSNPLLANMAREHRTVTAEVFNVPNQPLRFLADEDAKLRVEDGILAYGLARFLESDDPEWLVNLPMTKSVVRAMDTVTEFCRLKTPAPPVEKFVVAGISKRGWTTWLTAVVDPRVVAIAPMVFDALNIKPSLAHQIQAYGEYGAALSD
ncbi:PhoPQ-activated pathogenicity, partial [candidate division KSB3 bacterium]|nr:PhoPQ-activated pathogenicity [candidate division KSB3 bacterium]MBD3326293.1 PhoPQ-activated pathogenicity [candidate division KSB3 bacterium]